MYFVSALPFELFVILFSGLALCILFCLLYYRKKLNKTQKGIGIATLSLSIVGVSLRIGSETGFLSDSALFKAGIVTIVAYLAAFFSLCFLGYKHNEIKIKNMEVIKRCLIGLAICIIVGILLEIID